MNFPLDLRFKIVAIASQISVTDSQGTLLYYARQKAFKLREAVTVFGDEGQTRPLFRIEADRILDISARYRIEDAGGTQLAVLQRHGMRSFWRTHYELEVGGVIVNDIPAWRTDAMPYGGVKDSGLGREGLRWSIEDMTEPRLLAFARTPGS